MSKLIIFNNKQVNMITPSIEEIMGKEFDQF
jgi:hypothetical protein